METHESATLIQCAVRCWIARNSMYELEGLRELRKEGRTLSSTDPGQGGEESRVKDLEDQLHASREMIEESMSAQAALQERVNALNRENGELKRELQEGGGGGGGGGTVGGVGGAADKGILIELEVQKKLVQQLLAETKKKDEMLAAPVDPSGIGSAAASDKVWEDKYSKLEKQMEKLKESHNIALEIKGYEMQALESTNAKLKTDMRRYSSKGIDPDRIQVEMDSIKAELIREKEKLEAAQEQLTRRNEELEEANLKLKGMREELDAGAFAKAGGVATVTAPAAADAKEEAGEELVAALEGTLECGEMLEGAQASTEKALEGLLGGAEEMEREAERLRVELEASEGRVSAMEREFEAVKNALADSQQELNKACADGEGMKRIVDAMHAANVERDAEEDKRLAEIEGLKKIVDAMHAGNTERDAEDDEKEAEIEGLKKIVDAMHAANVERDAEDGERDAELEGLKKAVDELRTSNVERESEIKRLHADLEAAREKAQGGSDERVQDDGVCERAQGEIDLSTFESLLAAAEAFEASQQDSDKVHAAVSEAFETSQQDSAKAFEASLQDSDKVHAAASEAFETSQQDSAKAFEASQQDSDKVDAGGGGGNGEILEVLGRVLEGAEWLERDLSGVDEVVPSSLDVGLGAVGAESTQVELERLRGMVSLLEANLKKAQEELVRRKGVDEEISRVRDSLKALQDQRRDDAEEETGGNDRRVDGENQNQGVVDQVAGLDGDVAKSHGAGAGEVQQQSEVEKGQSGEGDDDLLEYYKTRVAKISKEIKGVRDERDAVRKEKKELVSKVESLEKRILVVEEERNMSLKKNEMIEGQIQSLEVAREELEADTRELQRRKDLEKECLEEDVAVRARIAEEEALVASMKQGCQKMIEEVNEEKEMVAQTMNRAMAREEEAKQVLERALEREKAADELEKSMKAVMNEDMTEKEREAVEERSIEERRAELDRLQEELAARQEAMIAELQLESDKHAERDAQLKSQAESMRQREEELDRQADVLDEEREKVAMQLLAISRNDAESYHRWSAAPSTLDKAPIADRAGGEEGGMSSSSHDNDSLERVPLPDWHSRKEALRAREEQVEQREADLDARLADVEEREARAAALTMLESGAGGAVPPSPERMRPKAGGESKNASPIVSRAASGGTPRIAGGTPRAGGGTPRISGGTPRAGGGTPRISGGTPKWGAAAAPSWDEAGHAEVAEAIDALSEGLSTAEVALGAAVSTQAGTPVALTAIVSSLGICCSELGLLMEENRVLLSMSGAWRQPTRGGSTTMQNTGHEGVGGAPPPGSVEVAARQVVGQIVGDAVAAANSLDEGEPEDQSKATEGETKDRDGKRRQQDTAVDLKTASSCPTCGVPLADGQPAIGGEGMGRSGNSGGKLPNQSPGMSPMSRPLKATPVLSPLKRGSQTGTRYNDGDSNSPPRGDPSFEGGRRSRGGRHQLESASSPNVRRGEGRHAQGLRHTVMAQRSVPDARPRTRGGGEGGGLRGLQDGGLGVRPRTTEHLKRSKGSHLEPYGEDPLVYGWEGSRSSVWQDKRTITELQMAWEDHRVEFEASLTRLMANEGGRF